MRAAGILQRRTAWQAKPSYIRSMREREQHDHQVQLARASVLGHQWHVIVIEVFGMRWWSSCDCVLEHLVCIFGARYLHDSSACLTCINGRLVTPSSRNLTA